MWCLWSVFAFCMRVGGHIGSGKGFLRCLKVTDAIDKESLMSRCCWTEYFCFSTYVFYECLLYAAG